MVAVQMAPNGTRAADGCRWGAHCLPRARWMDSGWLTQSALRQRPNRAAKKRQRQSLTEVAAAKGDARICMCPFSAWRRTEALVRHCVAHCVQTNREADQWKSINPIELQLVPMERRSFQWAKKTGMAAQTVQQTIRRMKAMRPAAAAAKSSGHPMRRVSRRARCSRAKKPINQWG